MMTSAFMAARLGPVELNVISLPGPRPSPAVLHALATQVDAGVVRLLDFVVVSRSAEGVVSAEEIDPAEFDLADLAPLLPGLAADEDLRALADQLPPGGSAAVVALELCWARDLAEQLAADDSLVLATERIPASVVNAIVDLADDDL